MLIYWSSTMKILKTTELNYDDLRALSLCKAKQEVRFYLMGVCIAEGFMAATNGHLALIVDSEELIGFDLIIPAEPLDSLIKKLGRNPLIKTVQLHKMTEGFYLLECNGSYELFKPVDGKFPDIKRIDIEEPTEVRFETYPYFNLDYLNVCRKIGQIYKTSPHFMPTSTEGVAYIKIKSNVHGLLMPMRS